jgi:hypothetical protein
MTCTTGAAILNGPAAALVSFVLEAGTVLGGKMVNT